MVIMGRAISIMAFSWAWVHGLAGAIATAGAVIASAVGEEEGTSAQEVAAIVGTKVVAPYVAPVPQQGVVARPMVAPVPQQGVVAALAAAVADRALAANRTAAADRTVAANTASR
jgi:hypothetical protein